MSNKSIPGIKVPETMIEKISKSKDKISTSIEIATGIVEKIKPLCSGIHIGLKLGKIIWRNLSIT